MSILYVIIPCYNEEEALPLAAKELLLKINSLIKQKKIEYESKILFIDDGSKDKTWELIAEFSKIEEHIEGVKLLHNCGHQNALFAGLMEALEKCDIAISMDADLQDDINAIDKFIDKYNEGCDIVYGVRKKRDKDTTLKRGSAKGFYRFMNRMGVEIVYNHADYRLMSKRALQVLSEYEETNLFLRGIVPLIGYRTDYVYYDRCERIAGKTKYSFSKMINLAIDGITSFSIKPLRIISSLGIFLSMLAILFGVLYALISKLSGKAVDGWAALILSIWTIGGIQLFCTGVLGEYIGKIYCEVKRRPRYKTEKSTYEKSGK